MHDGVSMLPVETLTHVLKLLDIPSRVKLASCNHTFTAASFRECSEAWKKVEFYGNSDLTDLDLSRLLTRVNAREVTKVLCVNYCWRIRGPGLRPLRNSRVLETVKFLATAVNDEDPTAAL